MLNANEFFQDFGNAYLPDAADPAGAGGPAAAEEEKGPPQPFLDSLVGAEPVDLRAGLEHAFEADRHRVVSHAPPAEEKHPPALNRLKTMADIGMREKANPQKRAVMVQSALVCEFGVLERSAEFQGFLAKARALQAAGLAGRELIKGTHPQVVAFLHDPATARVHGALRKVGGLDWRTVLAILQGVLYCDAEQRKYYRIWLETPLRRGGSKDIFDTDGVIKLLGKAGLRPGTFTGKPAKEAKAHPFEWYQGCIWVLTDFDDPVFYSHMGILGRFHHSSFLSGDKVASAGEWRVDNGAITWINGASGHYQPEPWRFVRTLLLLQGKGIPVGSVLLYRNSNEPPMEMAWQQYIQQSATLEADGWKTWPTVV
ncbi:MAG: hypothetical protein U1F56_07750 [Rubrivivax sp.]